MFLKNIMDLIPYDWTTDASKPIEDFNSQGSKKSTSYTIEHISDGVHSSSSSIGETSVRAFRPTSHGNSINKMTCVPELDEMCARSECVPEAEAEISDCSSREEDCVPAYDLSLSSNGKSPVFYSNIITDSDCRKDKFAETKSEVLPFDMDSTLKDSFTQTETQVQHKQSQSSVVTYKYAASKSTSASDSSSYRNSFAQTEDQILDKQYLPSVVTCKYADKKNTNESSDFSLYKNSFTQTEAQIPAASNCRSFQNVAEVTDKQKQLSMDIDKHFANNSITESNRKYKSCAALKAKSNRSYIFPRAEKESPCLDPVVYGTLFVFGCNGTVPPHLIGKMSTKYVLRKRALGNGLKETFSCTRSLKEDISVSPAKHVISYLVSSNTCIDVAFKFDSTKDMFQIGRLDELPIDFTVDDLNPSDQYRHGVSRYACRILVRRDGNHEARIYAAAFDSSRTIFLGEESMSCTYGGKMDGFTTNGVLIMKPRGIQPGTWREVSVVGNIYPVRHFSRVEISKRPRLIDESNILEDGTLIDLCGLTLLWRTPDGLINTPNEDYLSCLLFKWHRSVPESQLLSQTSIIKPRPSAKKAYVFLSCGHVVGLTLLNEPKNFRGWSCPVCRVISHIAELKIGAEPAFHLDKDFPTFAFKPCGHVASQRTVEYWSCVRIPFHRGFKDSVCPFCGTKLNSIKKYVKLLFPVM